MSDKIEVGASASGEDGINKLVTALDRLDASLGKLAQGGDALAALNRQMASMQASMTAGFLEMAKLAETGGDKVRSAKEKSAEKLLQDQIKWEEKQHAQANKFHYKQIEQQDTLLVKQRESYAKFWQSILAEQLRAEQKQSATQQRRDVEMHSQATKSHNDYISLWEKMLTQRQQIQERRDVEMHAARQRDHVDYVHFWEKQLATQESAQAKQLAKAREQQVALHRLQASEEERKRVLDTNFLTSSLPSRISTVEKAQTYSRLGGNAAEKFGSAAAGADLGALRRQLDALPGAAGRSQEALRGHNDVLREGHSLARGLAGSLGGLWLTYGSLVPLVAGAAIAASLKNIVTVGKEVEHQLNFVYALTGTQVSMDKFLAITDTSLSSVTEASNAMRALAQNGLNAQQALQVLPSVLKLATVGEMSVGQAALAATGAVAAFGLEFTETGRVADIFARTAATSNTSVLAITESMKQASTVASLFHVSIEETAAMLGLLAKINVTGGAAGTSFTNMLTGLYEPTEKGKRALKELGVETQTATGALKPYTQLLGEMKTALAGYNDYARVDFLGDIFTVRGVKSAELALGNIGEFEKKVKDATTATGFMNGVILKLENDTDGAFKRLSVSVESTFVRAFQGAAPYIQQIGLHLADAFKKDGDVQSGLTNLTVNIARLTGAAIDNAGAIVLAVVGYKALGALAPVIELFKAAFTAQTALTAATGAATAANAVHATAMSAGAASTATYTAMVEANAAATVAATAASRAWMATLLPALGALGIAVAAGAALWLLFRDNTNEADRANTKIANSLHVVHDQLDKEIERLEKVNKLWDERNMKYRSEGTVDVADIDAAQAQYMKLRAAVLRDGYDETGAKNKVTAGGTVIKQYHSLADELKVAKDNLDGFISAHDKFNSKQVPGQLKEKVQNAQAGLKNELERMVAEGKAQDSAKNFYIKDEKVRNTLGAADEIRKKLMDPSQRLQGEAEIKRIEQLRVDMKKLQDEANALRSGRAESPDKGRENSILQAKLKELDLERQLAQIRSQSQAESDRAGNARGQVGDLELINRELARKVALENEGISVARRQYELAEAADKPAKMQQYENTQELAKERILSAQKSARVQQENLLHGMAQDELRYSAQTAAEKGDHVKAFLDNYKLQYGTTIDKVNADLKLAQADLSNSENAEYAMRLQQYLDYLAKLKAAGEGDARGKKLRETFDAALADIDQKIQEVARSPAEGQGLISLFDDAERAAKSYQNSLPGLIEAQKKLQEHADKTGEPADQKAATDRLKKMQKEAASMRGIWIDMGKIITKSLTEAFGKGGKALGELLEIQLQYGSRQQEIQDKFEQSKKTPEDERKVAKDTASAQISAYGGMAQAAAGFFDEQSTGYRTLMTISKVFHAFELAQTMATLVPKAISAILTQGSGDPYTAFARMAAMTALVAGLGVAVSGGGSAPMSAKERQEKQGTGSVLGDSKAKSESLSRSLELVEGNTYQNLLVSTSMLQSLRAIESNIGNFAANLMRTTNVVDPELGPLNTNNGGATTAVGIGTFAAIGSYFGPIGTVIGAFVGLLAKNIPIIGKLATAVFGGKQSVADSGFSMDKIAFGDVPHGRLSAYQYADVKTDGGWFGSDRTKTTLEGLGGEGNAQIQGVLMSMYQAVFEAGKLLKLNGDDFATKLNSFVIDIGEVSLKGLSGEDAKKEIEAVFSKVGDDLARFGVGGLEQFQKVGEGYFETLIRVAQGYETVSIVMDSLGMVFSSVGMESIAARERLIDLAGGLEEFTSMSETFLQGFFTDAEQNEALRRRIQPALDQYGLSTTGADPMKMFKDFVVGLDTTTESGAQAYTTLLKIAPAFKTIVEGGRKAVEETKSLRDELDELTLGRVALLQKERDALDPVNRGLFDQIQQAKAVSEARERLVASYEAEASKLDQAIDRMKSFGQSLRDFRNGLMLGESSPLTPEQKYAEARKQYGDTLAAARGGDEAAQDKVQSAAQAFLDASRTYNASGSAYTSDYQRVLSEMDGMASWADRQVAVARDSLSQLKLQVGALVDLRDTVKEGTLTIVDAINDLLMAQNPGNKDLQSKSLTDLYQRLLGRAPDQAGLDFWQGSMDKGVSLTDIANQMANSNESALTRLYDELFKRAPDQAGMSYWLDAMNKGMSLTQVRDLMTKDSEYKGISATSSSAQSGSSAQVMANPYTVQIDSSETVQALTVLATKLDEVTTELETLRSEQAAQTGAQIEATMVSSQNNAELVAAATSEALKASKFDEENKATLL